MNPLRRVLGGLTDTRAAFGALAAGDRLARMNRSPQFQGRVFRNDVPFPEPTMNTAQTARFAVRERRSTRAERAPGFPIPLERPAAGPATGLELSWFGHASTLVEVDGIRVLLDPIWSERCSPFAVVGPRRLHPPPVDLAELLPLDVVLISHDHYDHLDMPTVRRLHGISDAVFAVPLGVGAHLERWGVEPARIVELDWGERTSIGALELILTPAQHFSGRGLRNRDTTLWGSWVLSGSQRRIFYSGDSGYFGGYRDIGSQYGPFDATLMQIGAYSPAWPHIHMTPEEAILAQVDLGGRLVLPVHWGTFTLAFHPWAEPVERLCHEAAQRNLTVAVPRPGQTVDAANPPPLDQWWLGRKGAHR